MTPADPVPASAMPTAQQCRPSLWQYTDCRYPIGLATVWMVQVCPPSLVWYTTGAVELLPTAQQSDVPTQVMPRRSDKVTWVVQVRPWARAGPSPAQVTATSPTARAAAVKASALLRP